MQNLCFKLKILPFFKLLIDKMKHIISLVFCLNIVLNHFCEIKACQRSKQTINLEIAEFDKILEEILNQPTVSLKNKTQVAVKKSCDHANLQNSNEHFFCYNDGSVFD